MNAGHRAFPRDAKQRAAAPRHDRLERAGQFEAAAQDLPRVSIIVTCFNYAKYIEEALDSVAAQTYPYWDCVIVDDCSTDNSIEVVERWMAARRNDRFRLLKGTVNQGQLAAIARGMNATEGEFVALLDADDFWLPTFLSRHVDLHLNSSRTASATCSDMLQIDADGRFLSGTMSARTVGTAKKTNTAVAVQDDALPRLDPKTAQWIMPRIGGIRYINPATTEWVWTATSAMMFRRRAIELALPHDPKSVGICADHYLIHICNYFEGSILVDEALGAYRRHQSNSFSYLPVLGSTAHLSPHHSQEKLDGNIRAMLRHLLDRYMTFSTAFGAPLTNKLIYALATQMIKRGAPLHEPRLRQILGVRWYYRVRLSQQLSGLRRRIAKSSHSNGQFRDVARNAS